MYVYYMAYLLQICNIIVLIYALYYREHVLHNISLRKLLLPLYLKNISKNWSTKTDVSDVKFRSNTLTFTDPFLKRREY
jgi:hypothetical protein